MHRCSSTQGESREPHPASNSGSHACAASTLRQQELYLDGNPIRPELLPTEVALLPALRKLYVPGPTAAAALQAQQQGLYGPGGGGAAAVAAGLMGQSMPFT